MNDEAKQSRNAPVSIEEAEKGAAVMQVIFDLARVALLERVDLLKRGFAMPDMPYEADVHQLLGVDRVAVAPVRGSVEIRPDSEPPAEPTKLHAATAEDVKRLRLS